MKRRATLLAALVAPMLLIYGVSQAEEEDPFAAGEDALAVADDDGSESLRAKLKLTKMAPDMIMVRVLAVNDKAYPDCVMTVKVLKEADKKEKALKLIGRGKKYRFKPILKTRGKGKKARVDLSDDMTQNNLGACYYPKKTKLIIKVGGVDLKAKVFTATEIYLK